jgi:glycosyltransferase involved in cell wall biosynthesis
LIDPSGPVRIALLLPTYWPEVMRGSERIVHDLGRSLANRGHSVTLLTSHRRRPATTIEDGMRVIRSWRPPEMRMQRWYEYHLGNMPNVIWRLLREEFEVAHAYFPSDAWAAVRAQRLGGPRVILSLQGIPTRKYLVSRRYRLEMLRSAVAGAAACTVLSDAAARPFHRYLLREPHVIPPGLYCESFATDECRAPVPTLVCAASLGDPRKRGALLMRAFRALRERRPDARLLVFGSRDPVLSRSSVELPEGAEWIEPDQRAEVLARAYASAWASVLPAVEEAFGLVLTESLAAGTPVVADRSGAAPEIIDSDAIGRLFEPDDEKDLARAMDEALELGARDETAVACRRRAADYDWSRLVHRYEELYASVIDRSAASVPRRTL